MIAVIPRTTCRTCQYSDPCLDCNGRPTGRGGCGFRYPSPANLKLDRPRRCQWFLRKLPAC